MAALVLEIVGMSLPMGSLVAKYRGGSQLGLVLGAPTPLDARARL